MVDAANLTGEAWRRLAANAEKFLVAGLVVVSSVVVAFAVRRFMRRSLEHRLPSHVYKPLENLVFYGIVLMGVLAAAAPFGVSLSSLLVAGGLRASL